MYVTIPKYLKHPDPLVRCAAAQALAFYGWPDSFDYLMACQYGEMDLSILVILGDRRAVPLIVEKYKRMISSRPTASKPGKYNVEQAETCIAALYHFSSPEILPFINSVIESSPEETIEATAKKIRDRIYKLYPETKPSQDE